MVIHPIRRRTSPVGCLLKASPILVSILSALIVYPAAAALYAKYRSTDGESPADDHDRIIDALGVSLAVRGVGPRDADGTGIDGDAATAADSGGPAALAAVGEINLTASYGAYAIGMQDLCLGGGVIPELRLEAAGSPGSAPYMTWDLTAVRVTDYRVRGGGGYAPPTVELGMTFDGIEVVYDDGSGSEPDPEPWHTCGDGPLSDGDCLTCWNLPLEVCVERLGEARPDFEGFCREQLCGDDDTIRDPDPDLDDEFDPDSDGFEEKFRALEKLRKLLEEAVGDLNDNEIVEEVDAYKALVDFLTKTGEISDEILDDFRTFLGCNAAPLIERVESTEGGAEAVLHILRGLQAILKEKILDDLSEAMGKPKNWLEWLAIEALKIKIKKLLPLIEDRINTNEITAAAALIEDIKNLEEGWPTDVMTEIWDYLKETVMDAVKEAFDDAFRWAAQKALKKAFKSGAKAAAIMFIVEDVYNFIQAMIANAKVSDLMDRYDDMLKDIIAKAKAARWCVYEGRGDFEFKWAFDNSTLGGEIIVTHFVRCFCEDSGQWVNTHVPSRVDDDKSQGGGFVKIPLNPVSGETGIILDVPPPDQWACGPDNCFVGENVTAFDAKGVPIYGPVVGFYGAACV